MGNTYATTTTSSTGASSDNDDETSRKPVHYERERCDKCNRAECFARVIASQNANRNKSYGNFCIPDSIYFRSPVSQLQTVFGTPTPVTNNGNVFYNPISGIPSCHEPFNPFAPNSVPTERSGEKYDEGTDQPLWQKTQDARPNRDGWGGVPATKDFDKRKDPQALVGIGPNVPTANKGTDQGVPDGSKDPLGPRRPSRIPVPTTKPDSQVQQPATEPKRPAGTGAGIGLAGQVPAPHTGLSPEAGKVLSPPKTGSTGAPINKVSTGEPVKGGSNGFPTEKGNNNPTTKGTNGYPVQPVSAAEPYQQASIAEPVARVTVAGPDTAKSPATPPSGQAISTLPTTSPPTATQPLVSTSKGEPKGTSTSSTPTTTASTSPSDKIPVSATTTKGPTSPQNKSTVDAPSDDSEEAPRRTILFLPGVGPPAQPANKPPADSSPPTGNDVGGPAVQTSSPGYPTQPVSAAEQKQPASIAEPVTRGTVSGPPTAKSPETPTSGLAKPTLPATSPPTNAQPHASTPKGEPKGTSTSSTPTTTASTSPSDKVPVSGGATKGPGPTSPQNKSTDDDASSVNSDEVPRRTILFLPGVGPPGQPNEETSGGDQSVFPEANIPVPPIQTATAPTGSTYEHGVAPGPTTVGSGGPRGSTGSSPAPNAGTGGTVPGAGSPTASTGNPQSLNKPPPTGVNQANTPDLVDGKINPTQDPNSGTNGLPVQPGSSPIGTEFPQKPAAGTTEQYPPHGAGNVPATGAAGGRPASPVQQQRVSSEPNDLTRPVGTNLGTEKPNTAQGRPPPLKNATGITYPPVPGSGFNGENEVPPQPQLPYGGSGTLEPGKASGGDKQGFDPNLVPNKRNKSADDAASDDSDEVPRRTILFLPGGPPPDQPNDKTSGVPFPPTGNNIGGGPGVAKPGGQHPTDPSNQSGLKDPFGNAPSSAREVPRPSTGGNVSAPPKGSFGSDPGGKTAGAQVSTGGTAGGTPGRGSAGAKAPDRSTTGPSTAGRPSLGDLQSAPRSSDENKGQQEAGRISAPLTDGPKAPAVIGSPSSGTYPEKVSKETQGGEVGSRGSAGGYPVGPFVAVATPTAPKDKFVSTTDPQDGLPGKTNSRHSVTQTKPRDSIKKDSGVSVDTPFTGITGPGKESSKTDVGVSVDGSEFPPEIFRKGGSTTLPTGTNTTESPKTSTATGPTGGGLDSRDKAGDATRGSSVPIEPGLGVKSPTAASPRGSDGGNKSFQPQPDGTSGQYPQPNVKTPIPAGASSIPGDYSPPYGTDNHTTQPISSRKPSQGFFTDQLTPNGPFQALNKPGGFPPQSTGGSFSSQPSQKGGAFDSPFSTQVPGTNGPNSPTALPPNTQNKRDPAVGTSYGPSGGTDNELGKHHTGGAGGGRSQFSPPKTTPKGPGGPSRGQGTDEGHSHALGKKDTGETDSSTRPGGASQATGPGAKLKSKPSANFDRERPFTAAGKPAATPSASKITRPATQPKASERSKQKTPKHPIGSCGPLRNQRSHVPWLPKSGLIDPCLLNLNDLLINCNPNYRPKKAFTASKLYLSDFLNDFGSLSNAKPTVKCQKPAKNTRSDAEILKCCSVDPKRLKKKAACPELPSAFTVIYPSTSNHCPPGTIKRKDGFFAVPKQQTSKGRRKEAWYLPKAGPVDERKGSTRRVDGNKSTANIREGVLSISQLEKNKVPATLAGSPYLNKSLTRVTKQKARKLSASSEVENLLDAELLDLPPSLQDSYKKLQEELDQYLRVCNRVIEELSDPSVPTAGPRFGEENHRAQVRLSSPRRQQRQDYDIRGGQLICPDPAPCCNMPGPSVCNPCGLQACLCPSVCNPCGMQACPCPGVVCIPTCPPRTYCVCSADNLKLEESASEAAASAQNSKTEMDEKTDVVALDTLSSAELGIEKAFGSKTSLQNSLTNVSPLGEEKGSSELTAWMSRLREKLASGTELLPSVVPNQAARMKTDSPDLTRAKGYGEVRHNNTGCRNSATDVLVQSNKSVLNVLHDIDQVLESPIATTSNSRSDVLQSVGMDSRDGSELSSAMETPKGRNSPTAESDSMGASASTSVCSTPVAGASKTKVNRKAVRIRFSNPVVQDCWTLSPEGSSAGMDEMDSNANFQ